MKKWLKLISTMAVLALTVSLVSISAMAAPHNFVDVKAGSYYEEAVSWAVSQDVTAGTDSTHFKPYANCTRAQIVTFLWRAAGNPTPTSTNAFVDVKKGDYFYDAVVWAKENNVTTGTDAHHFSPQAVCKRGQIVTFLYNYYGENKDYSGYSGFVDVSGTAYYYNAVCWAVENNITAGTDSYHFSPNKNCNRCQAVTFLKRAVEAAPVPETELTLTTDKSSVIIGGDTGLIFKASTNRKNVTVNLYETTYGGDAMVGEMKDDGSYAGSGDDMKGDGIYSSKMELIEGIPGPHTYYAKIGDKKSEEVSVIFREELSSEVKESMAKADSQIQSTLTDNFFEQSEEAQKTGLSDLIGSLKDSDLIVADSVKASSDGRTYSFEYGDGVLGNLTLDQFDEDLNGPSADAIAAREEAADVQTDGDSEPVVGLAETNGKVGTALILNSFPAFETKPDKIAYRTDFYEDVKNKWDADGLATTLDTDITVSDYENLGNYDIVMFSTHGSSFYATQNGTTTRYSVICLPEKSNKENDAKYAEELQAQDVVKSNGEYCIKATFFKDQYGDSGLEGKIILAECCKFMGERGTVNTALAQDIVNAGAKAVIGYHNSVGADYSREIYEIVIDRLIDGKSLSSALADAKSEKGNDDDWEEPAKDKYRAYPILTGNSSSYLISSGIQNGGFETTSSGGSPTKWQMLGDCRTLTQLGPITPASDSRMGILSTGIGSKQESDFENGTEGSIFYQRLRIPDNASTLSFKYNFVSEEYPEYIGSKFNDTFEVRVLQDGKTAVSRVLASVNTSTFSSVGGIDFDGGDSTVGQTGWHDGSVGVSSLRGKVVTVCFMIYDEGDSIYDSAVLLDRVSIN